MYTFTSIFHQKEGFTQDYNFNLLVFEGNVRDCNLNLLLLLKKIVQFQLTCIRRESLLSWLCTCRRWWSWTSSSSGAELRSPHLKWISLFWKISFQNKELNPYNWHELIWFAVLLRMELKKKRNQNAKLSYTLKICKKKLKNQKSRTQS